MTTKCNRLPATRMVTRVGTITVALLGAAVTLAHAQAALPSPTGSGPTPLLFAHPLINYRSDALWLRAWEQDLQSGNSLRLTAGSVTSDDFITDVELHLTQPMSQRWRALYDMEWIEARHLETRGQEHFLGLELGLRPRLGIQLQAHPTSRKEHMDLRTGVLWHGADRRRYLRLLVRWDDFLFGQKNDREGESDQVATSLEWTTRLAGHGFEVFSSGHFGSRSARSFPDSSASPELVAESSRRSGSVTRLRWLHTETRYLEVELLHHLLEQSLRQRGMSVDETYRNRIVDVALRVLWSWAERWSFRGELHRLDQAADRRGSEVYDYSRSEWMPAAFVSWKWHRMHRLGLGWLASAYDWKGSPEAVPSENGTVQKLELAWYVEFSEMSRFKLSASHEPDPQHFGGGNIQLLLAF